MAGARYKTKSKRTPQKKSNSRRRLSQPTGSTGYGGLIARGVRTLLSVLPGSQLTTGIADFVFKSLGYTKVVSVRGSEVDAEFQATGLTALFHLALKDVLYESFTHGTRTSEAEWTTNYTSGRLLALTVRVVPQAPTGQSRGQLALAFIPFRRDKDKAYYDKNAAGMRYDQVKVIPGAKSGRANRPLTVTFRPRVRDGILFTSLDMLDEIGAVAIAFDQTNRNSYGAFGMDEFSCTVLVSGVVRLVRPNEVPQPYKLGRRIDDKNANKLATLTTPDHTCQFDIMATADHHKWTDRGHTCHVTGSVSAAGLDGIVRYLSGDSCEM